MSDRVTAHRRGPPGSVRAYAESVWWAAQTTFDTLRPEFIMQADDQGWPFTGSGALDIPTVFGFRVLDARPQHSGDILPHGSG